MLWTWIKEAVEDHMAHWEHFQKPEIQRTAEIVFIGIGKSAESRLKAVKTCSQFIFCNKHQAFFYDNT